MHHTPPHSIARLAMLTLTLIAALTLSVPVTYAEDAPPPPREVRQPPVLHFDQVVRPEARFLFIGDELTQQMFYTRAVATGLISLRPEYALRFFNGGQDDATAASALAAADDLLNLTRPTTVFICVGLNDIKPRAPLAERAEAYAESLAALVDKARAFETVEHVVVMTPPPVLRPDDTPTSVSPENAELRVIAQQAVEVAAAKQVGFVDIYTHPKAVWIASTQTPGEPLTVTGRLPSETGHMVIASMVLRGIGTPAEQLDRIGWSPLSPAKMKRIRQSLGLKLSPPKLGAADRSRELYESMRRFDEMFFRLWRLSGRHPFAPPRDVAHEQAEEAWAEVRAATQLFR